jgi:hypothetical protein
VANKQESNEKKSTATTKTKVSKKKVVKKKAVVAKKRVAKNNAGHPISPRERYEMIATMAYYRAEQRNFEPGHDVEDWLDCESTIDGMLEKSK